MSDSRIEQKLEKIQADISDLKTQGAVNASNLAHHIKRTDLLEKRLDSVWQKALTIISIASALIVLVKTIAQ